MDTGLGSPYNHSDRIIVESNPKNIQIIQLLYNDLGVPTDYLVLDTKYASKEEGTGQELTNCFPGGESDYLIKCGEIVESDQPESFEIYIPDSQACYDVLAVPLGDAKLVLVSTKRVLEESERRYHSLFEALDHGLLLIEPLFDADLNSAEYRIVDYNSAWERQTGLKASGCVGKTSKQAIPHIEPSWFAAFARVAKTGVPEQFESFDEVSGRWYNLHVFPSQPGVVCVLFRDITEQKRGEKERQVLLRDLQIERDKLLALINNIPDEIWFVDEQANVILTNQTVQNKFGTNYIGVPIADVAAALDIENPDGSIRHPNEDPLIRATRGEELLAQEEVIRLPVTGKREHRRFNTVPVRDTHGQIIGAVAITRNISALKQAELALRASEQRANNLVAQLEEEDKNKNQFMNVLSHELRNPLAVIRMYLDLQQLLELDEDSTQRAFDNIERQTDYLIRLIDDLLDVTRIANKRIELRKERVNLHELIELALHDYQIQSSEKGIQLETILPSDACFVEADKLRLTQALENLLQNAIKFTPTGGKITVKLEKDAENKEALIDVEDTGEGIEAELLPKLFQAFRQGDESLDRQGGGLGLGLAIVKGMVELHGGRVEAFSAGLGKGTKFTIRLPLLEIKIKADKAEYVQEGDQQARRLSILLIEDNQTLAEVTCELLTVLGHKVIAAHRAAEGIQAAKELLPDVIISDIGLPDMSGYELAKTIRKIADLNDTALIAMSGYAQAEDVRRALESGFDQHLGKPVGLDSLRATLAGFSA